MNKQITLTIRQVQETDYEAFAHFLEENNKPEITRNFHPFPLTSQTACQIACTDHLDHYYIAIWDERIVGLCMLRGWEEGYEIPSFGIFVDYRYQGQGLGRRLTQFAINEAVNRGCSKIRLSVYASNVRAVHLYQSLGFQKISHESCIVAREPDVKIMMLKDLKL